MDKKYLPSLKRIQIKIFSLYPGDLNFTYDFIEGVNLIIGGNGVGKTTFLNILKYALIGLYRKETDVKRREYSGIEYRYEKRVNLPYKYFSNRMDSAANYKLIGTEFQKMFIFVHKKYRYERNHYKEVYSTIEF